jgi:hypothetical protein
VIPSQPQGAPQAAPPPDLDALLHEPLPAKKPDKAAAVQTFKQLIVSNREKQRLQLRITDDFQGARSNHDQRITKFRRLWRRWRSLNVSPSNSKKDAPPFQVPLMKWTTFSQWARCMQALLGDDAEIIAEPMTPEGDKTAVKVGKYMTWRVFEYMEAIAQLSPFVFRAILFGRAFAEIEYVQEYYWQRSQPEDVDFVKAAADGRLTVHNADGTVDEEVLAYDGPRLEALWPSQVVVPAQDNVSHVTKFAWKIRRDRVTPQQLLDGERRGKYQSITEQFSVINAFAQQAQEREYLWDDEKIDADEAEGVDHGNLMGNRDSLEVWRWYGTWRMPKGKQDAALDNFDRRSTSESEIMVSYLPGPALIVGIQDLRDVYPRMRKRDPFVDLAMVKDGSYWPPGLGEMLEDIEDESTINFALFRKAGQLSVGPILLYKPSSGGFDPEGFDYKPGTAIPTEDPTSVTTVEMKADLQYSTIMQQVLKSFAELVTGVSDQTNGLSSDRPNAPRTAAGQAMLLQEGNVRASLDMSMLRDDMSRTIKFIWELDSEYADESVFFRATGDDANGLFDTNNGFGTMTAEEREHSFAFDLKFATSIWSREARKQTIQQLYMMSVQNPLVMQNPRALWVLLNRMWEANGEKNFKDVVPEPPETDRPKSPKEEWTEMMAGEIIHVNPLDDDVAHITDHRARLGQAADQAPERRDSRLEKEAVAHIIEHENQRRRKMVLQELVTAAANQLQQELGGQPPPGAPPSGPAGPGGWTPPLAQPAAAGPPPGAQPPAGALPAGVAGPLTGG